MAYEQNDHEKEVTPPDSVLIMLRNLPNGVPWDKPEAAVTSINRQLVEAQKALAAGNQNFLKLIGWDYTNSEAKNMYGNQTAEEFLNYYDATINEVKRLALRYENTEEDDNDPDGKTWFVGRFLMY